MDIIHYLCNVLNIFIAFLDHGLIAVELLRFYQTPFVYPSIYLLDIVSSKTFHSSIIYTNYNLILSNGPIFLILPMKYVYKLNSWNISSPYTRFCHAMNIV